MQRQCLPQSLRFVVCTLPLVVAGACSAPDAPAPITPAAEPYEVLVQPQQLELMAGASGSLQVQVNDTRRQPIGGARVDFSSTDPERVQVTENGRVTALGPSGRVEIRVTSGLRERLVPVTVSPGSAQRIERLAGNPQQVIAGTAVEQPLRVRVLDAYDNSLAGVGLTLRVSGQSDHDIGSFSDPDGIAVFDLPVLSEAGPVLVRVEADANPELAVAIELSVVAAPAATLLPLAVPENPLPDQGKADHEIVLAVRDAFDNPVGDALVELTVAEDSGTVEPNQVTSGPDGLARATWHVANATARKPTLTATVADAPTAAYSLTLTRRLGKK